MKKGTCFGVLFCRNEELYVSFSLWQDTFPQIYLFDVLRIDLLVDDRLQKKGVASASAR